MEITYKRKLMFHQPAEKLFLQTANRKSRSRKSDGGKNPRVLASCGSSQASSNSRYKKILNKYSVYTSCKRVWKQEAIYISTRKQTAWKLLYVGRDSSELKPTLTSSFRARSSQGASLAYAAI